jgi:hypothetical protein
MPTPEFQGMMAAFDFSSAPVVPETQLLGESSKSAVPEPEEQPLLEEAAPNRQIQELRNDPYLARSYKNALIKQEEIIVVMTQLVDELGIHIADPGDIRKGVDIFFTDLMNRDQNYRNRRMNTILKSLTKDRGESSFFNNIINDLG